MAKEERSRVLKMVADGKITAEEGLNLLRALEDRQPGEENAGAQAEPFSSAATANEAEAESLPRRLRDRARRWWHIPLWAGVIVVLLSAGGMYTVLMTGHLNFWFYGLFAPLLLGVALIVVAALSHRAPWLIVDIRQKAGNEPLHIFFGVPLPRKLVIWGMRTFGRAIPYGQEDGLENPFEVLERGLSAEEPLFAHVDEDGMSVQLYLG